ncbi:MAG: metallophosphoesterase family protein [Desulfoplanes sp.]|nr:metallophosphoesterase family protein [Desulfoplanes sp.]
MPIAVISDIHANLEAFEAVLADIENRKITDIICLGDCIGYGPNPEEVVRLVQKRAITCVLGNHEMGVLHAPSEAWFNPKARINVQATRAMLSTNSLDFLATFPRHIIKKDALFVHGFPPDSPFVYLYQKEGEELEKALRAMLHPLAFVGHTHELVLAGIHHGQLETTILSEGPLNLGYEKCIVNVGSVGQPRDGNNAAKYVIWDNEAGTIEVCFVPYDFATTIGKIKALGFPDYYGERLR